MTTVASRELKNRLGKYLRLVKKGETVRVTDRGRAVAHIVPATPVETDNEQIIAKLKVKGSVTFGNGGPIGVHKPATLRPGKSIAEMVSEGRGR